jgi:Glycosyl hydrolase catalytic core
MRRVPTLAALGLLALSILACSNTTPIRPSTVALRGINGHPLMQASYAPDQINLETQLALLKQLNANAYRVGLRVRMGDAAAQNKWKTEMRNLIDTAAKSGIQILPLVFASDVVLECAPDQANCTPDSLDTIFNKAKDAARAFSSTFAADFDVYDLDNETENKAILRGRDGRPASEAPDRYIDCSGQEATWTYGGAPDGDKECHYQPERYARVKALLSGLSSGIKEGDPSAKRMFSGNWLHSGFFKRLKKDNVPFEILGWHWYWQDITNIDGKGRDFLGELHQDFPEIWLTEFNRAHGDQKTKDDPTRVPEDQRKYLEEKMAAYQKDPRIGAIFAYELLDQPAMAGSEKAFGLFNVVNQDANCQQNCRQKLGAPKPAASVITNAYKP